MNENGPIYLDHNATTTVAPEVVRAVVEALESGCLNPSSAHSGGRRATVMLEDARRRVSAAINCQPREIVFTSGGTESANLAIAGFACVQPRGRRHAVVSAIEHSSTLKTCRALASAGWTISWVRPGADGVVAAADIVSAFTGETSLVSLMLANNETGAIQPVREVVDAARKAGIAVWSDTVQAFGKMPVDLHELGVDMAALSGHKFHGPQGTGILFVRRGTPFAQVMHGGAQENSIRPGTQNVAGAVGLGIAAELAALRLQEEMAACAVLRDAFESGLADKVDGLVFNSSGAPRLCNTSSVTIDGVAAGSLAAALDLDGVCVSTGSACASLGGGPSHVLIAAGLAPSAAASTVRVSVTSTNSLGEIERAVDCIARNVGRVRGGRPAS